MIELIEGESFEIDNISDDDSKPFSDNFCCYIDFYVGKNKFNIEQNISGTRNDDGTFKIEIPPSVTSMFKDKTVGIVTVKSEDGLKVAKKELFFSVIRY